MQIIRTNREQVLASLFASRFSGSGPIRRIILEPIKIWISLTDHCVTKARLLEYRSSSILRNATYSIT